MNIEKLIGHMTLKEKVGQLCVPILQQGEITEDLKKYITVYNAGMIRYCPNAEFDNNSEIVGKPNQYFSPSETAEFLNSIQKMSKIPLFIAVDQEGSIRNDINRGGAFAYSGHMSFGAADDLALTYRVAKATGREFAAMGINLVQAPIVDVITYEGRKTIKSASFGESVKKVSDHALAMMKGFKDGGIASMAKHFPGYGPVSTDAHKGTAEIFKNLDALDREDIEPMKVLFKNGLNGVMTGHVITHCIDPEHPATISKKVITDYLRKTLGFDGMIETDAMRMKAIQDKYGTGKASVMAISAGCDLVLLRGGLNHFEEGYNALLKAAERGDIPMERIDASIRRILKQKNDISLLDNPFVDPRRADEIVGCREHTELAALLAKKSISALRDKSFPLSRADKVLVVSVEPQKMLAAMDDIQSIDMLYRAVSCSFPNTDVIMTKLNPADEEIKHAAERAKDYEIVIFGSCNAMLYENQSILAKALSGVCKTFVVVAMDSPYDIELMPYADNFIATYGVAAASMHAAADVMLGREPGDAKAPVTIKY
jgi:beta-N-acetylhexosaminidase